MEGLGAIRVQSQFGEADEEQKVGGDVCFGHCMMLPFFIIIQHHT